MSTSLKIVRLACLFLFGSWVSCSALSAAEASASRVTRVTLYRGQALVTRTDLSRGFLDAVALQKVTRS